MQRNCFHLSIPSHDLEITEHWYRDVLGCRPGRRSVEALILDLGGHQLVAQQLSPGAAVEAQPGVYPRHFGLVFDRLSDWQALLERVRAAGAICAVEPRIRYQGGRLEHRSFFLVDPTGNWLEFKHYCHADAVLGCHDQAVVGDASLR